MARIVLGIVGGFLAWFILASVVNLLFRMAWPGYARVEPSMTFTLAMLIGRLLLGALSSLCGGLVAAWIAQGNANAAKILGVILTLMFVYVHYGLWDKFPIWYHLLFLASLLPLTLLGALLLVRARRVKLARQESL